MAMPKKLRPRRRINIPPEAVMASTTARWLWQYARSDITFTIATVAARSGIPEATFEPTVAWFVGQKWIERVPNQTQVVYVGRV